MNVGLLLAVVRLAAPFTDGAVLQRGAEVNVWGTAAANETVAVSFGDVRVETAADANGDWLAKIPPLEASREGRTLQATAASGTAAAQNVVVGEVWIAAGQSNMGIPFWGESPRARDRLGGIVGQMTHRKDMRTANLDNDAAAQPRKDERISWRAAEPDFLLGGRAKAVATWFGLTLEQTLDVPVGIFCAQVGATCIETWIPDCREPTQPRHVPQLHQHPSRLFNGKIAPIVPYTVKGMIWYQGESNSGAAMWPEYCTRMHQLIDGWRKAFGNPKMPIYFAQLAPWGSSFVPYIQCEQARFVAEDPYAALAVICDAGNLRDIHPNDKQVVSLRLALHALRRDYGYDLVSNSPTLARWRIADGRFRLAFDHVKEWSVYDPDWAFRSDPSKTTHLGFEVAGADGRWVKARLGNLRRLANVPHVEYRGQIDGDELEVWADEVPHPQQLRYLFSSPWKGMLYNEVGLPVGAFKVDGRGPVEFAPRGDADRTAEVLAAVSTGATLKFAKGEYHFRSPRPMTFYVSNHDNPLPRSVFLPVTNVMDVTFAGEGATFIFHGEGIGLAIREARRVKVKGIGFDWARPFFTEARIVRFDGGRAVVQADAAQFPLEVEAGKLIAVGEGWRQPVTLAEFFAGDTRENIAVTGFRGLATAQGSNAFRIDADWSSLKAVRPLRTNDVVVLRNGYRPSPAVFLDAAHGCVLEDCAVHSAAGMGIIAQRCNGVTVRGSGRADDRRAGAFARAGTGRITSLQADATHFSNCRGMITVENCLFEGMVDDAINVHSTCLRIEEKPEPDRIVCRYMHCQSVGFEVFRAGETLRFIKGATLEPGPETMVAAVTNLAPDRIALKLTQPVPSEYGVGDAVENGTWQPEVTFRSNIVCRSKPRATLFTTPGRVVCEGNVFDHVSGQAIHLSGDAADWYESGACRDVLIRGNVFRDCALRSGEAVIQITPNVADIEHQRSRYHRNIRIEGNRFETFGIPLVRGRSVSNLVWRANDVVRRDSYPARDDRPFVFDHAEAVPSTL